MFVYLNGLLLGLSLIMALGPQNIFLIRQGALRQHAALSVFVCFSCDFFLITASVVGLHKILEEYDYLRNALMWFGGAFLLSYGFFALKNAYRRNLNYFDMTKDEVQRRRIIFCALGFSLLNPHAIIDSLVLIGGGSSQYPGYEYLFLLGVLSSSLVWFSLITIIAFYFSARLAQTHVWRRVEFASGILMLFLGIKLIWNQI